MSTDEYVPSYTEARAYYVNARAPQVDTSTSPAVEFDRFLAHVRREAKAEVLREIAPHLNDSGDEGFLMDAADRIETGDSDEHR